MKQYPWKFKLARNGIRWWQTEKTLGTNRYFYYFKWGLIDKKMRNAYREIDVDDYLILIFGKPLIGLHKFWYDCPHAQLNLYYVVLYWSTPWTSMPRNNKKEI